jgi:hypothetical protein
VSIEHCFTSFDWERPQTTTDFGADGHTASLSGWNELLQITAPHPECGLVFARGNFPDKADAILSRAQNVGGGGWGFQITQSSQLRQGKNTAQGLINFRWPFLSFNLLPPKGKGPASEDDVPVGTLYTCSFVVDGTFYQIVRIVQLEWANDSASLRRRAGPDVPEARPSEPSSVPCDDASPEVTKPDQLLTFSFGGEVRFGCASARQNYQGRSLGAGNGADRESGTRDHLRELIESTASGIEDIASGIQDIASGIPEIDEEDFYLVGVTEDRKTLSCFSLDHNTHLDMQLFIDQTPTALPGPTLADPRASSHYAYTGTEHSVPLRGKPSTVIMAISLKTMGKFAISDSSRSWGEVAEHLGINATSENSTARMWRESYEDRRPNEDRMVDEDGSVDDDDRLDEDDRDEMRMLASCVERILTVSSIPRMRQDLTVLSSWPEGIPVFSSVKSDSVKSDSVKGDSVKSDSVKGGSVKGGSVKGDSVKGDSVKGDSVKGDSVKSDSVKSDSVKSDSVKSDSVKSDSVKGDSVKGDSVKSDSVKGDSVKSDSVKGGSVEGDSVKGDSVKGDSVKSDSVKGDSVKCDFVKGADQISAAESLHSNGKSPVEGSEGTEGSVMGAPTYVKVHQQFVNMDALDKSSVSWLWFQVREYL